ncbi:Moulting cycle family protein [Brugia pahangi]
MKFTHWLVVTIITQIGLSIRLTADDINNIYKARMNKRTFEIAKNLHLNWYIYAIKALLGQVGKQIFQQLTKDKQKMLALCLDQIKDDRDLIASAKCLMQVRHERHFNTHRQKFELNQSIDKSANNTLTFITTNDYEEEKSSKNHNYAERYNRMSAKEKFSHSSHSGFENKFLKRDQPKTFIQFSRFSNISHFNHTTNFIAYNLNTFEHLIETIPISDSSNQQKSRLSREVYLKRLLSTDNKSGQIHQVPRKYSAEENEISGQITNFVGQSSHSSNYKKFNSMKLEKHSGKLELIKNKNFPVRFINFRKSDLHDLFASSNSSEQSKKLSSNSILSKIRKKKLWQRRRRSYRLITNHAIKSDNLIIDVKQVDKMPAMHDSTVKKTPVQQMAKFISVMLSGKEANAANWMKTYEHITQIKKQMDQQWEESSAKVYNLRLFDLVLGSRAKVQSKYKDFLSMAFDLLNGFNNENGKNNLNFRFLSPRVMPVMPDKMQSEKRVLSPSIMSFYKDDSPDNIISLPKLLEKSGMAEKDRQAVLEMIMDVSGAHIAIEMTLDVLNKTNVFDLDDIIFETTKRINEAFKDLKKSFSIEQKNDMKSRGFTFLEASQLKQILHQQGVNELNDVNFNLKNYEQLNRKEQEEMLWKNIERIAENKTEERYRNKRETVPILPATILAPFMFSPTFGLSILGPVVLSPSIFSPLILNPSILSPYILSPGVFLPFLISPYILSPYILSPLVGAPYILSPYVLSPNIINPYVLSPLILSPYILSPDIISPQALGGQILSPNAFSPSIYTDSVLSVNVLSPTWMSR